MMIRKNKEADEGTDLTYGTTMKAVLSHTTLMGFLMIGLFLAGIESWVSIPTSTASNAMLAFLAIASAAIVLLIALEDRSPYYFLVFVALTLSAGIHVIGSITYIYTAIPFPPPNIVHRIAADTLEVAMFSSLLLVAFKSRRNSHSWTSSAPRIAGLVALLLIVYAFSFHFVFSWLDVVGIQAIGASTGLSAFVILLALVRSLLRDSSNLGRYNLRWLLASFLLFAASCIPLIVSLFYPGVLWSLTSLLQAGAFALFMLAVAVPYQVQVGITHKRAVMFAGAYCLHAFLPFAITSLSETWLPGFVQVDLAVYMIAKGGEASLSGLMAFFIWSYSRRNPAWYHYPLILLFASWAFAETFLIVFWKGPLMATVGESLVPYIIGSIVLLLGLVLAIKWTRNPPERDFTPIGRWVLPRLLFVVILLWFGLVGENMVNDFFPASIGSPFGRALLLGINLPAIFLFIMLSLLLIREYSAGRILPLFMVGMLALWIIPNILKGFSDDWTAGWWASEVVLLTALLVGPALLVEIYFDTMARAERLQESTTLYSDLLIHDISNIHQAVTLALELLSTEAADSRTQEKALRDAKTGLMRADQLVKNVRNLGAIGQLTRDGLEPVDLVSVVYQANHQVGMEMAPVEIEFKVNHKEGTCFVYANALLVDLFANLFRNSVKYSDFDKWIEVTVESVRNIDQETWEIRVADHGRGIAPEQREKLFRRYMTGAEGTGLGLSVVFALTKLFGGTIRVEPRVPEDYTLGTVFVIQLLAAQPPVSS
ncbi:MAG: ATP-binding protein [Candidatus Thorarchaeota archaeon]|jgi:signal transduction histidine kinase